MTQPSHFSFPKDRIKVLFLENIHQAAITALADAGYQATTIPKSLTEEELLEAVADVHVLGIRSRTKVTAKIVQQAPRLLAVGCFGVGTNQVALDAATSAGIPVFNAPYGSTRSVAELTIASLLMLARKIGDKNTLMHRGEWNKSASGAVEVRDRTLGLIGYGHIGQQAGLLAEAFGMEVIFYDQMKRLPLGRARAVNSMEELLASADFVSLHVPAGPGGKALIGARELGLMRKGSYLLNLSRGSLLDLTAVREALETKQLAGAALDVYPDEPKENKASYQCALAGVENVVLTPHLGGSTEEAQFKIGLEVSESLLKFIDAGTTVGAVNFPQVNLPPFPNSHRILNVHRNVPGVLMEVNRIVSEVGANIDSQYLSTYKDIGYLIMDINRELSEPVKRQIAELSSSIKTRILF